MDLEQVLPKPDLYLPGSYWQCNRMMTRMTSLPGWMLII